MMQAGQGRWLEDCGGVASPQVGQRECEGKERREWQVVQGEGWRRWAEVEGRGGREEGEEQAQVSAARWRRVGRVCVGGGGKVAEA